MESTSLSVSDTGRLLSGLYRHQDRYLYGGCGALSFLYTGVLLAPSDGPAVIAAGILLGVGLPPILLVFLGLYQVFSRLRFSVLAFFLAILVICGLGYGAFYIAAEASAAC